MKVGRAIAHCTSLLKEARQFYRGDGLVFHPRIIFDEITILLEPLWEECLVSIEGPTVVDASSEGSVDFVSVPGTKRVLVMIDSISPWSDIFERKFFELNLSL